MFYFFLFFFNDTATTEIYTLSLHDALPIFIEGFAGRLFAPVSWTVTFALMASLVVAITLIPVLALKWLTNIRDRKSTRLNSSHSQISYAVFCLKKNKSHFITSHGHQLSRVL